MKKVTFLFVVCVSLTLMACGSGSTTSEKTDSTSVVTDTVSVTSGVVSTDSVSVQR